MSYDFYQGDPSDDSARGAFLMQLFTYVRMQRANFEGQWEESAALVWPGCRNNQRVEIAGPLP